MVESRSCALQCEISDFTSDVKWSKNGKPVTLDDRVVTKTEKGVRRLIFYKAAFDDAAEYSVKFADLESKAKLTVTGRRYIDGQYSDTSATICVPRDCGHPQKGTFCSEQKAEGKSALLWSLRG